MPPTTETSQITPVSGSETMPLHVVDHATVAKPHTRPWRRWAIGLAVVGIIAGAMAYWVNASQQADEQAVAERSSLTEAQPRPTVVGLGTVEPQGGVIEVALPSGAGDATIARMMVHVGDDVVAGQVLAHVDSEPRLNAAIAQARAEVALRQAERDRTLATVRYEQDSAKAAFGVAQVVAINARRISDRALILSQTSAMPAATRDDLVAAAQEADGRMEEARARLARFGGAPTLHPDVIAADAAVDAARAALATAETDLAQSVVKAPSDGTILSISVRPGEHVSTDGVLRMADTTAMVAQVEVFQTRIHAIAIGDLVALTSDALTTPLQGSVTAIGAEILPQGEISDDAAANTNARVIKVTVTLDAGSTVAAKSLTNLQVLATVSIGESP